jgi:hypothetical protein
VAVEDHGLGREDEPPPIPLDAERKLLILGAKDIFIKPAQGLEDGLPVPR